MRREERMIRPGISRQAEPFQEIRAIRAAASRPNQSGSRHQHPLATFVDRLAIVKPRQNMVGRRKLWNVAAAY